MLGKDNIVLPKIISNPHTDCLDFHYYVVAYIGSLSKYRMYYKPASESGVPVMYKYLQECQNSIKITISKVANFTEIALSHPSRGTFFSFLLILPMNKNIRKKGVFIQ